MSSGNGRSKYGQVPNGLKKLNGSLDETWERYKKSGSLNARNQLIEYYLPLVEYIAERLCLKLPNSIEVDDLMSAGVSGLMDSVSAFDQLRNVKFETFAYHRIRGAMLDELREMDWVPRLVRMRTSLVAEVRDRFKKLLGYNPTDSQVQKELGLSNGDFKKILSDSQGASVKSLDTKLFGSDSNKDVSYVDCLRDDKSPNPIKDTDRNLIKEIMRDGFRREERLLIILYYYEKMTLKEIGAVLGYCEPTVCYLHKSILKRLRARI